MPRVTPAEHFRRHQFLRMLWTEPGLDELFALLPVQAQWEIHKYYQPDADLTAADFEVNHLGLNQIQPQLAHLAGRHFHMLESAFIQLSRNYGADSQQIRKAVGQDIHRQYVTKHPDSKVSISVIANPEPDAQKLARALLSLAIHQKRDETTKP